MEAGCAAREAYVDMGVAVLPCLVGWGERGWPIEWVCGGQRKGGQCWHFEFFMSLRLIYLIS